MTPLKGTAIRRLLAFCVDWFVIVAWGGALFGIVMIVYSGHPPRPSSPWQSQAIGLLAMTIPVLLYFTLSESSTWQATLGKRALHLRIVATGEGRVSLTSSLLRNMVKFAPWELGHLVANQAAFSGRSDLPGWVYFPMALAFALPGWWVASIFLRGQAPYDLIASTRVVSSDQGRA